MSDTFKIAAVQAAPVFLDLDATIEKACRLIEAASKEGVALVAFPEAFVPGYPVWAWFIPPVKTHPLRALYSELHANSISIPGRAVQRLADAAGDCGVTVAIGVNERNSEASDSTLYNTLLYLGADGRVLGKHRKMIPTAAERLVWGQAAGSDLEVFDLPFGRLSGLLCWENYMPLARYSLTARGEQIHLAPTWDRGEPWIPTMQHIAKEGRCFVIGSCQAFHKDDVPDRLEFKGQYLAEVEGWLNPGLSVIVDPDGKIVAGPLNEEEGILYADVRRDQLVGPRWQLDSAGHYARPDVFELRVYRDPRPGLLELDSQATTEEGPLAHGGAAMESHKPARRAVTAILLLLIGLLILQALGYGIGFFFDPAAGLGEFASPPPPEGDELTVALIGLVGAGMLGAAAVLALAVVLILRGDPAGAYLAVAVGGVYVLAGLSVTRAAWTWDAYFYVGSGGLLLLLSAVWRWLSPRGIER